MWTREDARQLQALQRATVVPFQDPVEFDDGQGVRTIARRDAKLMERLLMRLRRHYARTPEDAA